MRPGARIGVDVGRARVGVARCDPHAAVVVPVQTLQRRDGTGSVVRAILSLADDVAAIEIVVGLPLSLSGADTASTADSRAVAALLAAGPLPVRLVDERLTTVSAQAVLHAAGRDTRRSRGVIDQVAAVILLQHALDAERSSGVAPGVLVEPTRE